MSAKGHYGGASRRTGREKRVEIVKSGGREVHALIVGG